MEKPTVAPRASSMRTRRPMPRSGASTAAKASPPCDVKLLLVPFRSGEAVREHPALQPWLAEGWDARSAVPRIVENGDAKLLVVLERPVRTPEPVRSPVAPRS